MPTAATAEAEQALRSVIEGNLEQPIFQLRTRIRGPKEGVHLMVDLNNREVETLTWAACGKTSAEIA